MTSGLRHRMTLLAVLPVTLVALLLTAAFLWQAVDNLEQGLRARGTALARQMASAAEYGIFSGQSAALAAVTDSTLRIDRDARAAAVVDAEGDILAASGEPHARAWPAFGQVAGHRVGDDVLAFIEPVRHGDLPVDDIYAGTEPGTAPDARTVGHVVIEMSRHQIVARSQALAATGLLIALAVSLLAVLLARRIAQGVTRPLLEAGEVVERIGHGDVTARMSPESAGTLEALAAGINVMAARIGMTQEELRARIAEATLDLLRQKEAAEHATIAKSHFLAAASHDLRQPLHALGLFVSGLVQSRAAEHEPRLVGQIRTAVDNLQDLLDAILDMSRLDSGKVVPRIGPFAANRLLDRLAEELAPVAEQKGLDLRVRRSADFVESDPQIVERILLNLAGNALRYTGAGGVLVGCRRHRGFLRIEVWDTGPGIPEHSREEIFEEYVQLDNRERDQARGLGLGLAICRGLADLLQAPIGVRSRLGRGSVFWIDLPLASGPAVAVAPRDDPPPREPGGDTASLLGTVLVVDSDLMVRIGMEHAIRRWGGNVLLAADREAALRCCRESPLLPDLAICAMRPPAMLDGIALAEELKSRFGPMAILLVTADAGPEVQSAARQAGFPLLKEPVSPGRLRAAVQQLLSEVRA